MGCAEKSKANKFMRIIGPIAEKLHTREQTVLKWQASLIASHLKSLCDNAENIDTVLNIYFRMSKVELFVDMREHLEDCELDENDALLPEELEGCIADLLLEYALEDVRLGTQIMYLSELDLWANLPAVDFDGIEEILEERRSESSVDLDEDETHEEEETIEELTAQLGELRELFSQSSAELATAAQALADGIVPESGAARTSVGARREFQRLASVISKRMTAAGLEEFLEPPASLAVLESAITEIKRTELARDDARKQIAGALRTLEMVVSLASKDGREFTALDCCRRDAADLRARVLKNELPELSAEILAELKPYEAIIKMVSQDIVAQDDELQDAEQIATTFGASLVFALGRGMLVPRIGGSDLPQPDADTSIEVPSQPTVPDPAPLPAEDPPSNVTEKPAIGGETETPVADSESLPVSEPAALPVKSEETAPPESEKESPAPAGLVMPAEPEEIVPDFVGPTEKIESELPEEQDRAHSDFERREGETSATFAAQINAFDTPSGDSLQRLVWLTLADRKASAAYHLSNCITGDDQAYSLDLLPTRIRASILGLAIRTPGGSISDQLKLDYASITNAQDPDDDELALAYRLLMIASALRPAVLAPDTNAKSLIELGAQGLPRLDRLYWLCTQLADYANLLMPLDAAALEYIDTSVNITERLAAFQTEANAWWTRAPHLNFKYAPAGKIWKAWLEATGPIGRLIMPVLRNDRTRLDDVKEILERMSTDTKIRNEINSEEKSKRFDNFWGKINYNALAVFTRHVREAVDFATRWVAMQTHQASDVVDYRLGKLLELRVRLDSARTDLKTELERAIESATDMRVAIALGVCQTSLDSLIALLHPKSGETTVEPPIKYLLGADLLLVPGLPMTDEWEPRLSPEQLLRLLVHLLANPSSQAWDTALALLGEDRRDHEAVDRILEYLAWEGAHKNLFNQLSALQDSHLKQCQDALSRQIDDCTHKVELGVSNGFVRDHVRAEYLERIDQITRNLATIRNFEVAEAELRNIVGTIESSRMLQVEQVRGRLESEGVPKDTPAFRRIQAAIDRGDVDTVNEYIDLTLRGDNLPDPADVHDSFCVFFPKAAAEIDEHLSNPQNSGSLVAGVVSGKGIPGVDMAQVPGAQIQEATAMLEAWAALKKTKRARPEHLKVFFERLGFTVLNLSDSALTQRTALAMDVVTLKHRDQCPIPYFGSMANGHYRVICIWDRPSEDEILNTVRQGRQGAPTIVLYFGRLTEQKRRTIAQLSRADNLNFVLIDELLVAYLCGERGSRLPVMYDCALPFSYVNPYTTTSSNVPVEMFYGRRWEREQITDPMGSCFVYGGRQLGKTALLLSIKEEFHNPAEQRVALWIDLRSYGDDIWMVLSRAFKDLPDVDLQIGDARSEQKLIEKLQTWLLANNKRRILLLLDEADRFLESDSVDDFRRTSVLKGLMERTNRRFKAVFAGLHNVQRTTKQTNHPLAHFGEPICVGPLLDRGEWKEAKALIERPFWSLGYRFESPDLVTRILSRTNYYPSLIQLYCNQIFLSVKLDAACLRNGPPYIITAKHVEDAYFSRQFENAIKEKFQLTLNLDPRYRVLALIIALNSLQGAANAMSVNDIRERAFDWWKLGFADSRTEEDFRVLLEEMLGLGILREATNGEFALRTPNLLSLLGRQDQIENTLLQISYNAPPPPYSAHVHRTSDRKQSWRRNPLSDQQDSELRAEKNSVTVIFGTQAAGIDDVEHFVSQSFEPTHFNSCNIAVTDVGVFRKYLEDIRTKALPGTTVVLVRNSPWTLSWIQQALAIPKGRTRFTSIVFIADPETTWGLINDRATIKALSSAHRINTVSLQPWHPSVLWQWLGDCGIGSNAVDEQEGIGARTGRWPMILEEFRSAIASGMSWKTALEKISARLHNGEETRVLYLKAFGLNVSCPHTVINEMASLGGQVSLSDLVEILGTVPKSMVENVFHWADLLGLIQPAPGGEWAIDPIVSRVLVGEGKNELVDTSGTP